MIDFEKINRELKAVQVKAKDIREIKGVLNKNSIYILKMMRQKFSQRLFS